MKWLRRACEAAADEIYVTAAVLMVVEQQSLCWLTGRLRAEVNGEAWAQEFRHFPNLAQVARDGGNALAKGVAVVNAERQAQGQPLVVDQGDHFHALYPFRPRSDFPSIAADLADACQRIEPFPVTLAEFRFFRHASGHCTLWLAPEPLQELRQLQAARRAAFPDGDDLSRFPTGYTPHLSVGQLATVAECQRVHAQLQADLQPITFTLVEMALLARDGSTPFVVERRVNLGTGAVNGHQKG
jgi:2'-5' RNA ligase